MTTVAELSKVASQLPELILQVQQGNEVLVTQESKAIARIVPVAAELETKAPLPPIKIAAFSKSQVVTRNISRAEIAEDLFSRE